MPQPMHSSSDKNATLEPGLTSIQSLPAYRSERSCVSQKRKLQRPHASPARALRDDAPTLTTGQDFLHSCLHFLGLQRSALTSAMRVSFSSCAAVSSTFFALGGMAPARAQEGRRGKGGPSRVPSGVDRWTQARES
jgi:hypothetical protein